MAGILLEGENVSGEERAAHARKLAAEKRQASLKRAKELKALVGAGKLGKALQFPGTAASDRIVEPGPFSIELKAGDHLRIIDLEGQQAVDFLVYDAANEENRYNAANTMKLNRSIYLGAGFKLYSDLGEVLMTIVEDTVGRHDTLGGCCSKEVNYQRYGIKDTANCRDNFITALAEHGMHARDIPANINFFMYVPVRPDGSTRSPRASPSRATMSTFAPRRTCWWRSRTARSSTTRARAESHAGAHHPMAAEGARLMSDPSPPSGGREGPVARRREGEEGERSELLPRQPRFARPPPHPDPLLLKEEREARGNRWWARVNSNYRPPAYQASALTT